MGAPTIVFDLDGTLIDTAPDLIDTLNAILSRHGVAAVAFEEARTMIGAGVKPLLQRALAARGKEFQSEEIERLYNEYLTIYAEQIADRSRPFPGLEPALDTLAGYGCSLAVCTNKLEWLSVRLLDALGLSKRFVAICGGDTFGLQKPEPELLWRTIGRAAGHPGQAVMVGDSISDIALARAAGIPIIAVDYGYTETPVGELGPDRVISALSDLPNAVFELLRAGSRARAERP
jgi:phosphoglycolate phosphatase